MPSIKEVCRTKLKCIDCGKEIKDYRSKRCRDCWEIWYKKHNNFGEVKNENNVNWKGNAVGYYGLHNWIRRNKPRPEFCEICGEKEPKQVANISGEYKRDINDYQWLCVKCHVVKDGTINNLNSHNKIQLNIIGGYTK